ncbi:MAG: hypothetical protein IJW00_02780 [Clostridia bacterium]|nr:hypothetical protein [Clostridia bacterium]
MYAIITVAILVYIALIALLTALPARKRHWSMVLARTGIVMISALISVPLSKFIASKIGHWLYGVIEPMLSTDLQTFMGEVPLVAESAELIVGLLLAPILFLLLFIVIRAVLNLVIWIIERVIPKLRHRSLHNTAIAVPIGAVNGILVALVTLIPLCGYVAMGSSCLSVYHLFDEQGGPLPQKEVMASVPDHVLVEPLSQENSADQDALINNIENIGDSTVITVMNTIGLPLFEEMTSGTLDNGNIEFSLTKELPHLTDSAALLIPALGHILDEEVTQEEADALISAMQKLLSSDWVAEVAADSVSFMAEMWQEGNTFMLMNAPDVGDMLQPVLDTALTVLSTESADTLRADVETILTVLTDLMAAGFLEENPDYEALLINLGESGLLNRLMTTLNANLNMAPLATELKALSVRVVSSVLGETLKNTDQYDPMIDQVANELNKVIDLPKEEREAIVRESIQTAFVDHGVSVPEDVAVELSEKAIEDLGADGKITNDELKQYLIDHVGEGVGIAGDITQENGDIFGDVPDLDA